MRIAVYLIVVVGLSVGTPGSAQAADGMSFRQNGNVSLDLLLDGTPLLRYMIEYDPSTPQRRFETYKPFLHVYDGAQRLTNGPDGESEYVANQIRYPHHRGLFIGWNKLSCNGKRYDLWHMPNVAQVHQRFEGKTVEGDSARFVSIVHWNDPDGQPILVERRIITARPLQAPALVCLDFVSELKAVQGDVELDGDPEHAGMQYRAHNDVAAGDADVKARYLFHEEGIDPRKDQDLPWVAVTYGLGGNDYTVAHMNHSDNPKGTVYSAYRDYARFGAFAKTTVPKGETLTLRYRFWIGRGQTPPRQTLAALYVDFAD